MGGATDTQRLVRMLTKLALTVREKESEFSRKSSCIKALVELKYESEQGRHDLWHTVPKIADVLGSLLGTSREAELIKGEAQSLSELSSAWGLSRGVITKKQLPLLGFVLKYANFIPVMVEKQATRLTDEEYDRSLKIRQANVTVQNIEKLIGRTEDVLYLYYLIQVYDTTEGKKALAILSKKMKQQHPLGVKSELEALQRTLGVPSVSMVKNDYVSIINSIYDTAEKSRGLHDKTLTEALGLKRWIQYTLMPSLERNYEILTMQADLVDQLSYTWKSDYSESDIMSAIDKLKGLVEEEDESRERIKEELSYYMRTNSVLRDILSFTKKSESQLMSHHANLFGVVVVAYNLFPLLAAFYSVDSFSEYWDAAEEYVLPTSTVKRVFSSISLRGITGIF